ncbi:MAG: porin family protein [Elusimicrobia bacterium]|nr:porin family protein [Candidatus Liberimonas magnetica]
MNKNSFTLKECIITSALLLVLPLAVFGEIGISEKVFSIGPHATYSTPVDADQGQWYAGAQARFHLTPSLRLEGSIDYRRNNFNSFTIITTYPFQGSLLVYLMPGNSLNPFLLAGGGWYYTEVNGPANFSNTDFRFGLHAGAGFEIMINEGLSLDASYRYVWLQSVTSKDLNALDKNFQDSGTMVTLALNILF